MSIQYTITNDGKGKSKSFTAHFCSEDERTLQSIPDLYDTHKSNIIFDYDIEGYGKGEEEAISNANKTAEALIAAMEKEIEVLKTLILKQKLPPISFNFIKETLNNLNLQRPDATLNVSERDLLVLMSDVHFVKAMTMDNNMHFSKDGYYHVKVCMVDEGDDYATVQCKKSTFDLKDTYIKTDAKFKCQSNITTCFGNNASVSRALNSNTTTRDFKDGIRMFLNWTPGDNHIQKFGNSMDLSVFLIFQALCDKKGIYSVNSDIKTEEIDSETLDFLHRSGYNTLVSKEVDNQNVLILHNQNIVYIVGGKVHTYSDPIKDYKLFLLLHNLPITI